MGWLYANVIIFQTIHGIDSADIMHTRIRQRNSISDAVPRRSRDPIILPKAIHQLRPHLPWMFAGCRPRKPEGRPCPRLPSRWRRPQQSAGSFLEQHHLIQGPNLCTDITQNKQSPPTAQLTPASKFYKEKFLTLNLAKPQEDRKKFLSTFWYICGSHKVKKLIEHYFDRTSLFHSSTL